MGGDTPMVESSSDSDDQVYSIGDDYNDSDAEEFYDGDYHTNETTASAPSTENAAEDNDVEMPPSTSETSAAADVSEPVEDEPVTAPPEKPVIRDATSGPKKQRVVIQDVAYATYHALYTDSIVFAPLSSSFSSRHEGTSSPTPSVVQPQQSMEGSASVESKTTVYSRREWIALWKQENPGNLVPCSPKSVYRLADRLDLKELKERAADQILKSLTVENIAHEVFSPFAATFDDIRKVEVEFFLKNWEKIRDSMAMRDVWQQIRVGRHPGFEEVWPVIVQSLVFLPPEKGGASVTDKH
ncbi:hypothetical protein ONZ45_g3995 [Pleurotus djamor]|nr:hypothetical protein ONZ45_g3995 [Pleurotus djamor]